MNYVKGKNGHSPTRAHALASAASEAGRRWWPRPQL